MCSTSLSRVAKGFPCIKNQGTELKRHKNRLLHPKHTECHHYWNTAAENEWIRLNILDTMGNYLFCQECVVKALKISKQKLSRQWKVKQRLFQHPIEMMTKSEVNDENLNFFVVMPEGLTCTFKSWWETLTSDQRHNQKDDNSQPNGRWLDSRNQIHYFLPKFTTISLPN